eukprot:7611394-Alexandrium_andersonii.AAC.1
MSLVRPRGHDHASGHAGDGPSHRSPIRKDGQTHAPSLMHSKTYCCFVLRNSWVIEARKHSQSPCRHASHPEVGRGCRCECS